jgi:hypothetical protein
MNNQLVKPVVRVLGILLAAAFLLLGLFEVWQTIYGNAILEPPHIITFIFMGLVFGFYGITGKSSIYRHSRKSSKKTVS